MQEVQKKIQAITALLLLIACLLEPIFQPQYFVIPAKKPATQHNKEAESEQSKLSAAVFLHNNLGLLQADAQQAKGEKPPKPALPVFLWALPISQAYTQGAQFYIEAILAKSKALELKQILKTKHLFLAHLARAP